MENKSAYKEKIYNFNTYLYSKFASEEQFLSEIFNFENMSDVGNVHIRGLYGKHYADIAINDDGSERRGEGSVGTLTMAVNITRNGGSKIRIQGEIRAQNNSVKKIKMETKFNAVIMNNIKTFQKVTCGNIHKSKINLKCKSKFLHREGTLSRTFSGTLNKSRIVMKINDLGQKGKNKTLLTGTVTKGTNVQSFNFTVLWESGHGYIQQIEGILLPILICPMV